MTITNPSPTRAPFDQEKVRSKAVLSIDWTRGVATAITGQGATVTRSGNAFVTAGNGVLTPIGTNRPRLLHFVGANGGLLTEASQTNLLSQSINYADAAWTKFGGTTVDANFAVAPDGKMTATRVNFSASGDDILFQLFAPVTGTHQHSFWIKADAPMSLRFRYLNDGSGSAPPGLNVTTQWQRITESIVGTGTGLELVGIQNNSDAVARSFYLWNHQVEAGNFPSTDIISGASATTRPVDEVSYANQPQPAQIVQRGGITFYHRFVELGQINDIYFQLGDGTARRLLLYRDGTSLSAGLVGAAGFFASTRTSAVSHSATIEAVVQVEPVTNTTIRVRLGSSTDGGTFAFGSFSSAMDATDLIADGWGTTPTLYVGARNGGNDATIILSQSLKSRFGLHGIDTMRALV
jgi:hypothetical protein